MGSTDLLPLQRKVCWGFFRPKNPTASAGCEPSNLGTKSQHATSRPPKPLLPTYTAIYIGPPHIPHMWCTAAIQGSEQYRGNIHDIHHEIPEHNIYRSPKCRTQKPWSSSHMCYPLARTQCFEISTDLLTEMLKNHDTISVMPTSEWQ